MKFHRFPKDKVLVKKWVHATGRQDKFNVTNAFVCSKHFLESDYEINLKHKLLNYFPKNYRGLRKDAVPKRNLPLNNAVDSASSGRIKKKEQKRRIEELLSR